MTNYCLQTLEHLRTYEEVMLYNNLFEVSDLQQQEVLVYLAAEYKNESVNYPYKAPLFDPSAALWAAKTVYAAAQLILYREHEVAGYNTLLQPYAQPVTPSSILSADLLLRFLPHIIYHLTAINPEDKLAVMLEDHLKIWHYSGISHSLPVHSLDFDTVISDKCLHQLYIDRVIENKKLPLATHPVLITGVRASLGMFTGVYWNDFKQQVTPDHEHN